MERMRITAMGVVTATGRGRDAFLEALRGGATLVAPSGLGQGRFAAELRVAAKSLVHRKGLIPLSRASLITSAAVEDLLESSGCAGSVEGSEDCGLVVGTAHGHLESKASFHETARREGPQLVSPIVFPNTIINSLAGHAAILFGLKGPNSTVTSGRRSGLEALMRARSLIESARAERVVVGACDEVSAVLLRALDACGELSHEDPGGPRASVPFSPTRSGIYPGEAAAAVLLERQAATRSGGDRAASLALLGWGEATAVGRSLEQAVGDAMRRALETAGVDASRIGWVALSGSGDAALDAVEASAFRTVLGGGVPAAALKATFGETFGAAGLLACAAAVLARQEGFVPPTPGYTTGDLSGLAPALRPLENDGPVLVSAVDPGGAVAVVVGA